MIKINADGSDLINSPRWNLSGGLGYDVPWSLPGALRISADANYQSAAYSSALNRPQDRYPAQTFVNGDLVWTAPDKHWSATLAGRNLMDSHKPVSSSYTPSTGVWFYNVPDPRTVLLTIRCAR